MAALEGRARTQNARLCLVRNGLRSFGEVVKAGGNERDQLLCPLVHAADIGKDAQGLIIVLREQRSLRHAHNGNAGLALKVVGHIGSIRGEDHVRRCEHDLLRIVGRFAHGVRAAVGELAPLLRMGVGIGLDRALCDLAFLDADDTIGKPEVGDHTGRVAQRDDACHFGRDLYLTAQRVRDGAGRSFFALLGLFRLFGLSGLLLLGRACLCLLLFRGSLIFLLCAASCHRQQHDQCQQQCDRFFHFMVILSVLCVHARLRLLRLAQKRSVFFHKKRRAFVSAIRFCMNR